MAPKLRGFDPYHKWLGIPREEQPPTHYRLLGLRPFESDPDVIEAAAEQRMAHLRSRQAGPQAAFSQQLLNEIATARLDLLIPVRLELRGNDVVLDFGDGKLERWVLTTGGLVVEHYDDARKYPGHAPISGRGSKIVSASKKSFRR